MSAYTLYLHEGIFAVHSIVYEAHIVLSFCFTIIIFLTPSTHSILSAHLSLSLSLSYSYSHSSSFEYHLRFRYFVCDS